MERRDFLKTSAFAAAGAMLTSIASGADQPPAAPAAPAGGVPMRPLGRTGVNVSCIGLGGFHIGIPKEEQESIRLIRSAIDRGVTFMDNCWDYHNGKSEVWMGKALRDGYRAKAFLMTKIDGLTKKAAAQQIDESLKRLGVETIDLMQHHEIIRLEDPDRAFAPGGAHDAMMEAQKAGKIRFQGFTGHKDPFVHLRMLETARANGFRFDAVQMPLNVLDAHFRSFEKQVLPVLVGDGIGVLGMKPLASGAVLRANVGVSATECLHYALNLPTSVVITGCESMERLDQAIEAAKTFKPMAADAVAALLAKTAPAAAKGRFEGFKTTQNYDGTARNPQWLG